MKPKGNLLLVEDDKNLGFVCKDFLEMQGYVVDLRNDGMEGFTAFTEKEFDLVLLDIMMPHMDGLTLSKEIKRRNKHVPIIFLTAKNLHPDIVKGFKAGADDYITKPFNTELLQLRIEAILRRTKDIIPVQEEFNIFTLGKATFDYPNLVLTSTSEQHKLTKKEAELLRLFCLNRNQTISRETALKTIWGDNDYFLGRSMDVYIAKLRKHLKKIGSVEIETVHGQGFKLNDFNMAS